MPDACLMVHCSRLVAKEQGQRGPGAGDAPEDHPGIIAIHNRPFVGEGFVTPPNPQLPQLPHMTHVMSMKKDCETPNTIAEDRNPETRL